MTESSRDPLSPPDIREIAQREVARLRNDFLTLGGRLTQQFLRGETDILPEERPEYHEAHQRWLDAEAVLGSFTATEISD